jgi:hypothetical protein
MQDAIIEKLNRHFNTPPETEADVIYAFVQVRKLLERSGRKGEFPRLKFFCDWAVHGGLAGTEAQQVLIEMDDRLRHAGVRTPWEIDPDGRVYELVSHRALLQEMSRYLTSADVSTAWTGNPFAWHQVSRFYSEIVKDCPLTITRKDYDFPYVARLEITECKPAPPIVEANPHADHIGWTWVFSLNDGRTFPMTHTSSIGR